jgi:hypothetical protein
MTPEVGRTVVRENRSYLSIKDDSDPSGWFQGGEAQRLEPTNITAHKCIYFHPTAIVYIIQ